MPEPQDLPLSLLAGFWGIVLAGGWLGFTLWSMGRLGGLLTAFLVILAAWVEWLGRVVAWLDQEG